MRKMWKNPRNMIQCIRSSYCIDNLFIIYHFSEKVAGEGRWGQVLGGGAGGEQDGFNFLRIIQMTFLTS